LITLLVQVTDADVPAVGEGGVVFTKAATVAILVQPFAALVTLTVYVPGPEPVVF
jgi:hypothetical protein